MSSFSSFPAGLRARRAQDLPVVIARLWQHRTLLTRMLWPLSLLFGALVALRRQAFARGWLASWQAPLPLLIVGNLSVGGTGKTPAVIALARALHAAGHRPGILSRGYGAVLKAPTLVVATSTARQVGDEPLLIARALAAQNIPVCVYPRRVDAARRLLAVRPELTLLICDDGLQHYRLARRPVRAGGRDVELVLMDGRGTGNGWMLPAGPLREPADRERDLTLVNDPGFTAADPARHLWPLRLRNVDAWTLGAPHERVPLASLAGQRLVAACGIGHPRRFFDSLRAHGLNFDELPLPDHFDFASDPFVGLNDAQCLLITEKDAVKCAAIPRYRDDPRIKVVPVVAEPDPQCLAALLSMLPPPSSAGGNQPQGLL